jgi:pimeloyl-ACP methyl ester carboxylesterase
MALDRPLLAVDLPGHGYSDGGRNGLLDIRANAADVATVIRALAPNAQAVIGMSLGGITTIALAGDSPDLVRKVVLVDITPGVSERKSSQIAEFVNGPATFDSFDELLARTIKYNPTRTEASLRRGILHNAEQRDDGTWVWRYQRHREVNPEHLDFKHPDYRDLWDVVAEIRVPLLLTRGMREQSVVSDEDEVELLRRLPSAQVEHFTEAGHSLQGDTPVELAESIERFVFG